MTKAKSTFHMTPRELAEHDLANPDADWRTAAYHYAEALGQWVDDPYARPAMTASSLHIHRLLERGAPESEVRKACEDANWCRSSPGYLWLQEHPEWTVARLQKTVDESAEFARYLKTNPDVKRQITQGMVAHIEEMRPFRERAREIFRKLNGEEIGRLADCSDQNAAREIAAKYESKELDTRVLAELNLVCIWAALEADDEYI